MKVYELNKKWRVLNETANRIIFGIDINFYGVGFNGRQMLLRSNRLFGFNKALCGIFK